MRGRGTGAGSELALRGVAAGARGDPTAGTAAPATNTLGSRPDTLAALLERSLSRSCERLGLGGEALGPDGAKRLVGMLADDKDVRQLDVKSNEMGPAGGRSMARLLRKTSTLTRMDLDDNALGAEGAALLSEALANSTSLLRLSLARNDLGNRGMMSLAMPVAVSALTWLSLEENRLGSASAGLLAAALRQNGSLRTLSLAGNDIGPDGVMVLAEAFGGDDPNRTLTDLDLSGNNLRGRGAEAVARLVRAAPALRAVRLGRNRMPPDACPWAPLAAVGHGALEELDVSGNPANAAGGEAVCRLLRAPGTRLARLSLESARMGSEGVAVLSRGLRENRTLLELNLENNRLGLAFAGVAALSVAVRHNTTLRALRLRRNDLTGPAVALIMDAVAASPSVTELDLGHNFSLCADVCDALGWLTPPLARLGLDAVELGSKGGLRVAEYLAGAGASLLVDLSLRDNRLGTEAGVAIGLALERNSALMSLDLSNNGIAEFPFDEIVESPRQFLPERYLRLGGNPIRSVPAEMLEDDERLRAHLCSRRMRFALPAFQEGIAPSTAPRDSLALAATLRRSTVGGGAWLGDELLPPSGGGGGGGGGKPATVSEVQGAVPPRRSCSGV